jgi:hypothetical protein
MKRETWELYYSDEHGWQPSNLGRFETRAEAEAAAGPWLDGYTRAHGTPPLIRVGMTGSLTFPDQARAERDRLAGALHRLLRACQEAARNGWSEAKRENIHWAAVNAQAALKGDA